MARKRPDNTPPVFGSDRLGGHRDDGWGIDHPQPDRPPSSPEDDRLSPVRGEGRRRRTPRSSTVFDTAITVPRAGLPDANRLRRRSLLFRLWVWTGVVLLPLALLALFIGGGSKTAGTDASAATSPGRAAATVALTSWLRNASTPLPGGVILGWTGSVQLGEPVTEEGSELTTTITLERFDVAAAGVIYDAGVQVATDSRGGSIAISTPSATPKAPPANDDWEDVGPWAGFGGSNAQSTPAIVKAVELWAEAFTSGDADTLRLSVGDPSARHTYSPLIGVASTTVAVGDGWQASPDDDDTLVFRVTLSPVWASTPSTTVAAAQGGSDVTPDAAGIAFDVLVKRASTASPVVVAWSPPGLGPDLKPYANAATGPRTAPTTSAASTTTSTSTTTTTSAPTADTAAPDTAAPAPADTAPVVGP